MSAPLQDRQPPRWMNWWRKLLRYGADWSRRHIFERGDFIDTGQAVMLKDLGLDSPDRYRYVPSGRSVIPRLLRKLKAGPDDVFIDVGSGKGRAVFQAARSPLKRVIGLELADELNEVARYNVEHNRDRLKCQDVELITGDAVEYTFPDDLTIAYFYHPFSGTTFERVIDNLIASLDRNPRELHLVYGYPMMADYIRQTGRFEQVGRMRSFRPGIWEFHEFLIFRPRRADVGTTPADVGT